MDRPRLRNGLAGLATLGVFLGLLLTTATDTTGQQPKNKNKNKNKAGNVGGTVGTVFPAAGQPIPMNPDVAAVEFLVGLTDDKPTDWSGSVQLSEGRIVNVTVIRGGPAAQVTGNTFKARSVAAQGGMGMGPPMTRPAIRVQLDAPPTATLTLTTGPGTVSVTPADLRVSTPKLELDGKVSAERQEPEIRLTGPATEDDYPALARGPDGSLWMASVAYTPGRPIVQERILAGSFEELEPSGNGDQIKLWRCDGHSWFPPLDVTAGGLDVWRPAVAVDGRGVVHVVWSQQDNGRWNLYHRRYTPGANGGPAQWADAVRLSDAGGDIWTVATTDSQGVPWVAWMARRDGVFAIHAAALTDGHPWRTLRPLTTAKVNHWSPAIAADGKGNVYVAYDTYEAGNYDVRLARIDGASVTTTVIADSPHFEARPSIVCDGQDRVWVAYEEGDVNWGKDFLGEVRRAGGVDASPGYGLYIHRTVRVKCVADDKLMEPADDLGQQLHDARRDRLESVPRLGRDEAGGLWLLYRKHPVPGGVGEMWNSFAHRFDGKSWSPAYRLPSSANQMDNRPALLPFAGGLLVAYSGDGRTVRTMNRVQSDLFMTRLRSGGPVQAPELVAARPAPASAKKPAHADEAADVARMRAYRITAGGKELRLYRGEFHRHTEYTAHRDGDGLLEDSWRYALDTAQLDWMGNGDHDNGFGHEYLWWQIQKTADLFQQPPRFVAAHTYERSVAYPNGHRNVIMPRRGIRPLPRGDLQGTPEKGTPDTKLLYAYLHKFGAMCSSHTSATTMGTDWRDNDPVVEPVVEIFQGARNNYEHLGAPRSADKDRVETQLGGFQPAGFVWHALEKGYKLGFQSSSDHGSTHVSFAVALVAEPSRQGIIDAFKARHSYAATDNIILEVRSGEKLMGDIFTTDQPPALEITAHGTGPIAKVHVIRDNRYVYTTEPKQQQIKLRYTDMEAKAGQTSYYYVRVEQADGGLAWASPMWITYKP